MKGRDFTVVGLCDCGCDDAFIEHVTARDAEGATRKAIKLRDRRAGTVAAVFEGHIKSVMSAMPVRI